VRQSLQINTEPAYLRNEYWALLECSWNAPGILKLLRSYLGTVERIFGKMNNFRSKRNEEGILGKKKKIKQDF
jgi:hypothetical protein